MIELIIKKDDREINRYFLPQGVTTLGRAEDNTIILDDSCVSRKHARIKVEGGPPSDAVAPALTALPDTPAGHTLTAYLAAYNSGDLAVMRGFIRDSTIQASGDTRTLDQRVAGYKRIHDDLGALRLIGVQPRMREAERQVAQHGGLAAAGVAQQHQRGIMADELDRGARGQQALLDSLKWLVRRR